MSREVPPGTVKSQLREAIEPESLPLLCVKAKNHFRASFAGMARCLIDVDAPGPASAGLFHYKFHHAPQHIW